MKTYEALKMNPATQVDLIYALCATAFACRCAETEHGFGTQTPGEDIALMHSELSEALEEFRNGHKINETYYNKDKPTKPEGVPSELADVVIRILGFCERNEIDLGSAILEKMSYNDTREFRHGGKVL